jgi:hypothetical protein
VQKEFHHFHPWLQWHQSVGLQKPDRDVPEGTSAKIDQQDSTVLQRFDQDRLAPEDDNDGDYVLQATDGPMGHAA